MKRWRHWLVLKDGTTAKSGLVDEIADLQDVVEDDPDWNDLERIVIRVSRPRRNWAESGSRVA